jgi:hypothetical protein
MKLTLPQLRKLVESTVKDVMKSKRSLRETFGDETDDPNHPMHDYESNLEGQECPDCGGTNTVSNESVPSMMGYGTDDSSHCNDCDSDFSFDPFSGRPNSSKTGGMKASLDRHVKESRMRTRRR